MTLPTNTPTAFCKAYIQRDLQDFKDAPMNKSFWTTMERIIARADELQKPFDELINEYGFYDRDHFSEDRHAVWLILELIYTSSEFAIEEIKELKEKTKQLDSVTDRITRLCNDLSLCYEEQNKLLNETGHQREDYQDVISALITAGSKMPLFNSYIHEKLTPLAGQFDQRYWPSKVQLIKTFEDYETKNSSYAHHYIPETVISSRPNVVKNFVLSFDGRFEDTSSQIPETFRFSNAALADILNVVLDIDIDHLYSAEAIKNERRKNAKKC